MLARRGFVTLEITHVIDEWQHTHVGRFRVEGVIGRGGMGVVLRAFDPHLQRPVAIKLLADDRTTVKEGTTVNLRERVDHDGLLDEARALAQIADPNVLAVHEVGTERGQTFLVMELVDGVDLRQWLAATPRSVDDIYRVFAQAAQGLAAAHRRGIIHRDFKPENVLISADGRVRVCDFGIAAFARSTELIHTGTAGTPRYMAPELWRDQGASVQSDVYAFAATLVEALCNELPADPAVIERELTRRGVDTRVRAAIARALDPDRTRRPDSIDEITRAFAPRARPRWVVPAVVAVVIAGGFATTLLVLRHTDTGAAACGDGAQILGARWNERERASVRAGIAATSASAAEADDIIARLDDYARSWRKLHDETCTASVAAARRPARLACLDRRLYDLTAVIRALDRTPSRELALGRSSSLPDLGSCIEATEIRLPSGAATRAAIEDLTARVIGLYDRGLATIGSEGDQAALVAARQEATQLGDIELAVRVDRIRGQLLGSAGKLAEAERAFGEGYELALAHHQDSVAAVALVEGADISRLRDDIDGAESKLRIARAYLERSTEATPYSKMRLYRALADVAVARRDYAAARDALDAAQTMLERMQPRDPLWLAELALQRARVLDSEGKLAEALVTARSAEQQLRRLGKQGVPDLGDALLLLADLERLRGNTEQSLALQRERVELTRREYPADARARVEAEGLFGVALLDAGKYTDGKATFEQTLARIDQTPALAPLRAEFLGNLARAQRLLGDFDPARALLQSAIDDQRQRFGEHSRGVGFFQLSYAYLELEAGDTKRATMHARVAEEALAAEPAEHIDQLDLADVRIGIALAENHPDVASQLAERVLALLAERKIDDARNERFWLSAAAARNLLGRPQEARELAQRAVDRAKARNAAPIDVAVGEAEVALARYQLARDAAARAELRRRVAAIDDPRTRTDHARMVRWLAANRIAP